MSNINDTYFEGYYKDIWRSIIPAELTPREVNFMLSYFKLKAGDSVLDLMCGYGRHALALAKQGIAVTAVDNLSAYIDEIKEAATKEHLPIRAIRGSVLDFKPSEKFDLAICMGNSLNFFERADVAKLFSMVASSLKPGGHLLINSWSIAEIVFRNFKETNEGNLAGTDFSTRSEILFHPTRMQSETTMLTPGGEKEIRTAIDYIYSINELEFLMKEAGLTLKEVYSIPGKKVFSFGEPRAYIVGSR